MNETIKRENYIEKIIPFIDKRVIKILSGIRRSGKSTIMEIVIEELYKSGVDKSQIFHAKLNTLEYEGYTSKMLLELLKSKLQSDKKTYFCLDEIQEIDGWERAVNEIFDDSKLDVDIYLTGSNSRMLSSEISTYLTGRYVCFEVLPLSLKEIMTFRDDLTDKYEAFDKYLELGGFPLIHAENMQKQSALTMVHDIYNTIVFTDIVGRNKIRNTEQLNRIVKFVFENIGKTFSAKSISDYLKSQNRKIDVETVYNYLEKLESTYIIYRCNRYDIQGKEMLKTQEKFYLSDVALKYCTLGYDDKAISGILENIVYLELRRRGYDVYVGKLKNLEIDFVAEKQGEKIYVQVAKEISKLSTQEREYENLRLIDDNYPKYVLTLNDMASGNYEGIKSMHIADWLMEEV